MNIMVYAGRLSLSILFCFMLITAAYGRVIYVSPSGSDSNSGLSPQRPLFTIQHAIDTARAGDVIVLQPGIYRQNFSFTRSGKPEEPIILEGMPGSLILGDTKPGGRIIQIKASYIVLKHLNVNGHFVSCDQLKCYHDKLVYVVGSPKKYLTGIKILYSQFKNAYGECLRIRFSRDVEIAGNSISYCGLRDFRFGRGRQNGEGIYVGTSPKQLPAGVKDLTRDVYIHDNVIATHGSECVDVKEATTNVRIINNVCLDEMSPYVGSVSIRGNNSTVSGNIFFNNRGAGVRLGGNPAGYGILNSVIGNYFDSNAVCAIKIMRVPQGKICGNSVGPDQKCLIYPKGLFKRFSRAFESCR